MYFPIPFSMAGKFIFFFPFGNLSVAHVGSLHLGFATGLLFVASLGKLQLFSRLHFLGISGAM
jgi:hypothetical protein